MQKNQKWTPICWMQRIRMENRKISCERTSMLQRRKASCFPASKDSSHKTLWKRQSAILMTKKYDWYLYCSHCGKWIPKEEALYDKKGSLLCPFCKRMVRTKARCYKRKEKVILKNEWFSIIIYYYFLIPHSRIQHCNPWMLKGWLFEKFRDMRNNQ